MDASATKGNPLVVVFLHNLHIVSTPHFAKNYKQLKQNLKNIKLLQKWDVMVHKVQTEHITEKISFGCLTFFIIKWELKMHGTHFVALASSP